jgi:hypothetical protein
MGGRQLLSKPDGKDGRFLLLNFQLNLGLSRLGEAKILCRSPGDIITANPLGLSKILGVRVQRNRKEIIGGEAPASP